MEDNGPIEKVENSQKMDGKIEAIKEIIFGKDIADYNKRFDMLEDEFKQFKEDYKSKTEELETNFNDTIESMKKEHEKDIIKVSEKLEKSIMALDAEKADIKALGKMLQNIGEKLQAK